jgi:hypothetical protein
MVSENPDSETMVLDGEKREIPEPITHAYNGKFGEQSYDTVQKLVVDWTPEEERRAKLKYIFDY